MPRCKYFLVFQFLLAWTVGCGTEQTPQQGYSRPEVRKRLQALVANLPADNWERRIVENGRLGDGVRQPWMDVMRREGVKTIRVEVYMTWFFGPRHLRPVRVIYFTGYDEATQIVDEKQLARFRASGFEDDVKNGALRYASNGMWMDLPHSILRPFRAATTVTLFDDEWLPIPPRMFTTFGPGRPQLIAAVGENDEADVNRLLSTGKLTKKELNSALFYTCGERNPKLMQQLLDAGADPNVHVPKSEAEFYTPLMVAIWDGSPEAAKTLVAAGAKVNGSQGNGGETPLTLAASRGPETMPIVKFLLDKGADGKAANEFGLTVMMHATHRQPAATIELLIKSGVVVDARDHRGRTALLFASERGNTDAVRLLLAAHADVNAKDVEGNTPLSVAQKPEITDLLRKAGARYSTSPFKIARFGFCIIRFCRNQLQAECGKEQFQIKRNLETRDLQPNVPD